MPTAPSTPTSDPVRTSVAHLLAQADGIPCSAAAQAFAQLVQPAGRFGIALDILLPLLSSYSEVPRRICAAYILYYMYAAHPIAMNPFRSAFAEVFLREREMSRFEAERGGVNENEQLVWVLWKILKGDGNDLGPYSPLTLARSPLPPKLRAAQLTVDDALTKQDDESFDSHPSESQFVNQVKTDGLDPSSSISPASVEDGSGVRASPLPQGDDPKLEFMEHGMRFLLAAYPSSSISHASVEDGSEVRASPLPQGDDPKLEFMEHGMRLLLAACQRVLSLSEQRVVVLALPHFSPHTVVPLHSLPPLLALNPALGHPLVVALLNTSSTGSFNASFRRLDVLDVLRQLPPTLPSFDILGRLLRDPTLIPAVESVGDDVMSGEYGQGMNGVPKTTIADLTRSEVLGAFILNSIAWVERFESQAKEGLISDDRAAKGVQNLCRFYNSLIKLGLIDPSSDVQSAEMAHFALAHAHFEDANALYRVLVMGKF
ncbi:hypothetical protein A7U60_g6898 [Sanghuangporus baumii]|uniref:CCR4-NOT transcription complex subunit 11 n=1 Tax=Sanghuangporus baumii TaxID=108892 RepID=A0A9Q5HU23_SANBA|nr:hypothetical protein A7U60_g6898 [Sanghuangporus baumii]